MVSNLKLDLAALVQEDRIHSRVYTDPGIFELEMERIFGRAWVYVAHESELAQGGDYKTTYLGLQPVIVTRNADDGQVYVLYNRCRHRGATVCQLERGNASYFRCAYHGWTYSNRGDLIGVTYRQGYGPDFDFTRMGLVQVPRVASYRGFIFASLAPAGPSLDEHLGGTRPYFDLVAGLAPQGVEIKGGLFKVAYHGNWKLQLENIVDGYHFSFVHESLTGLRRRRGTLQAFPPGQKAWDLGNGHSILGHDPLECGYDAASFWSSGYMFAMTVFPNLMILAVDCNHPTQVRVVRPIAAGRTEVWHAPTLLRGVAAEVNIQRLRRFEEFFGPAGFGNPDDREMFERLQAGVQARGNEQVLLARGLWREEREQRGSWTGDSMDEVPQRALYRQWRRMMATG